MPAPLAASSPRISRLIFHNSIAADAATAAASVGSLIQEKRRQTRRRRGSEEAFGDSEEGRVGWGGAGEEDEGRVVKGGGDGVRENS